MGDLFRLYRKLYEQCFVPIFVRDDFSTEILLEGCRLSGIEFFEYTLRRKDAKEVIPTLKESCPWGHFTVGSTLDSEVIVHKLVAKYPQLMTCDELAEAGVDGFVSMLPMSSETIRKYADTHLILPGAQTTWDALRQLDAGAHFIKVLGNNLELVRALNAEPAFRFCPVFVTGGVRPETMGQVYVAGAVLTAAGFDVILKDTAPEDLTAELAAERIRWFVDEAKKARAAAFPELAGLEALSDEEFLDVMPNFCVFQV